MNDKHTAFPILIVDDEANVRMSVDVALRSAGLCNTVQVTDAVQVLPVLRAVAGHAIVLLDLIMPNRHGEELLQEIMEEFPEALVVIVSGVNDLGVAVDCMRKGASDYIVKPIEETRLTSCVRRLLEILELRDVNAALKRGMSGGGLKRPEHFARIVTGAAVMRSLFHYVEAVARSEEPILVTGETGVGKELFAKAFHDASERKGAFVAINMCGLDANLISDTLFGHVRGAYTGADTDRPGFVEKAADGTLFLDEIGNVGLECQMKLLRLLQEREFTPLGSDVSKLSRARIVAATNADLSKAVEDGTFRKDLYFRLHQHHLHIPPLRERMEDLVPLLEHFIEEASRALGRPTPSYPKELAVHLRCHGFPGNVRELKAMAFDATAKCRGGQLAIADFFGPAYSSAKAGEGIADGESFAAVVEKLDSLPTLKESQKILLHEALRRTGGSQKAAARLLGVTQQAISQRVKKS